MIRKVSGVKRIAKFVERRPEITARSYIVLSILTLSLFLAFTIRILNFRYGFYLSEFDPYWHYRVAKYILENGIGAFLTWTDNMSWVPEGRNAAASTPPGLPLALVGLYLFVNKILGLNVSLLDLAIIFPPLSSMLAVVAVFLLGKEIANDEVGIISAVLIAFNGSLIDRTHLGFFKHETIGIPLIVFSLYFLTKGIKEKDIEKTTLFSVLSGFSLGYLSISWTGYLFAVGLNALLIIATVFFTNVNKNKLMIVSAIVFGLYLSIAAIFPRSRSEILSINLAIVAATFLLIAIKAELEKLQSVKLKISATVGIISAIIVLFFVGVHLGFLSSLYGKIVAILNPFTRTQEAIVESVAEHKITSWYTIFYDNGLSLLLFAFAIVTSIYDLSNINNLLILTSGISSLYFSTLMVRLELIFSPFSSVLSAYGVYSLLNKIEGEEIIKKTGKMMKRLAKRPWWVSYAIIVMLTSFLLAPSLILGYGHAGTPVTIASSSLPFAAEIPDWLQALEWIRENTPKNSVIMAWWDYGYWITTLGDRPTIIDNATINTTQVAMIGKAFISNDTIALPIMKKFNVSYVVVFSTLYLSYVFWAYNKYRIGYWGDEVKWIWMAEIGYRMPTEPTHNRTLRLFGDPGLSKELAREGFISTDSNGNPDLILPNRTFVLTKLMVLSAFGTQQKVIPEDPHFELVFVSYPYRLVSIYKVKYNYEINQQIHLSASSKSNETSVKWSDSYEFAPNRTISIFVSNLSTIDGEYILLNGSTVKLNSSVYVALVDRTGIRAKVYLGIGENKLLVYNDKIICFKNNKTEVIPYNYKYPLHLEFYASVSKPPTNYKEVINEAEAEVLINKVVIGWP